MAAPLAPLLLAVCAALRAVSAGDSDCMGYVKGTQYVPGQHCNPYQFCCGTCDSRYCCSNPTHALTEDQQEDCVFRLSDTFFHSKTTPRTSWNTAAIASIVAGIVVVVCIVLCCVCPCCCLYKLCRKPRPVVATTTHTTVITSPPAQPAAQYPGYQPVPAQPGYGAPGGYGTQVMYPAQPMPTAPYQGQPYGSPLPPPYQEFVPPGYQAPHSQAGYAAGQPFYPMQPAGQQPYPSQPQGQPYDVAQHPPPKDYAQPPYNPDYVNPPPNTGH
ncbi:protein shisa-5 isoform X1 [Denticeps clupeoides]|uniref:protein shisa-5 isoform X1 n=1 Tax=Denticeps clupeoides TaxID=299321 RepID=UPI0010A38806|nr:protein shisa-5 isoform X1 [Denticeps clupeoides]